jgi:ribonuclease-3
MQIKGMVVTHPGHKPAAFRVDQVDREQDDPEVVKYPEIVHFGSRPPQLSYAGCAEYQKAYREFVKFRHLLANMAKPTYKDKRQIEAMENKLLELRNTTKLKREVTVGVSCQGFFRTGFMTDIVQHALLLPVFVNHLRFHASLDHLEKRIGYR